MTDLLTQHTGKLKVIIRDIGEFTPDFDPEIIGYTPTLFDYVGHAYACLVTDLTTRLSVKTEPSEWKVINFSPDQRILEVEKVSGEQISQKGEELMAEKHIIKIVSTPEGPGISEEIRRGWVGSVFEAEGPVKMNVGSALNPKEYHGSHWVYNVPSELALAVLKYRNRKSWEWFNNQPGIAPIFCFDAKACAVVS